MVGIPALISVIHSVVLVYTYAHNLPLQYVMYTYKNINLEYSSRDDIIVIPLFSTKINPAFVRGLQSIQHFQYLYL